MSAAWLVSAPGKSLTSKDTCRQIYWLPIYSLELSSKRSSHQQGFIHVSMVERLGHSHKPFHLLILEGQCQTRDIQKVFDNQLAPSHTRQKNSINSYPLSKQHVSNPSQTISSQETHAKVITPPNTQNNNVAPTLFVYLIIDDGVEKIPVPITRLMIRNAVDHVPSLRSISNVSQPASLGKVRLR